MENPAIKTRLLYIEEIGNLNAEAFARMIERERSSADGAVEIRYLANGEREGKTLVEVIPEKSVISNGIALRTGGVYWITGGAGGLGKIIARHLTQASDATVVLTGRSDFGSRRPGAVTVLSGRREEDSLSARRCNQAR